MIYLDSFHFPTFEEEDEFLAGYYKLNPASVKTPYPFKVLSQNGLHSLDFKEITILYGGNGSGKSTALNAISNKLGLVRNSVYNKGDFQSDYLRMCDYDEADIEVDLDLKDRATLITSDDIFKYMLDTRNRNAVMKRKINHAIDEWISLRNKNGKVPIQNVGLSVEEKMNLGLGRKRGLNRSQYIRATAGTLTETFSNGETGFMKFVESIVPDKLYLLDEPENSLSCALQIELAKFIEDSARYLGCQFIIATHSPFLLAMECAKIYNLDSDPVTISKFWELPNMKLYYDLFRKYEGKFDALS